MSGIGAHGRVVDAVAALDAALDALAGVDLAEVPAASAGEVVLELARVGRRLQAHSVRAVAALDSSQGFALDGAASASAWLRARTRVTPGVARAQVRVARRLPELPSMAAALATGAVGFEHVSVVARAMHASPQRRDTIAAAEATFTHAATELDAAQLSKVVTRWAHTVDPLDAVRAEVEVHAQRSLAVSRTFDGAVAVRGLLGPEAGGLVLAALEAMSTAEYRNAHHPDCEHHTDADGEGGSGRREHGAHGGCEPCAGGGTDSGGDAVVAGCVDACADGCTPTRPGRLDERTPTQRRADALTELCRRYLDSGDAPEIMGVRPHLSVLVPLDSLQTARGQAGAEPADLDGIGPLSTEAARRLGCDATLTGIGIDATGMPTSYGRTTRVVPPGLRKLIVARDHGCTFPGCDRPPSWCQAHHLVHWAHGGTTDASNLALVCTHHHHALHEGGFTTRGDPQTGTLAFHRPDGRQLLANTGPPRRSGRRPRAG